MARVALVAVMACGGLRAEEAPLAPLLAGRLKPVVLARKEASCAADAERLRAAFRTHRGRMETPAEQIVIPLKAHANGATMLEVTADRAQHLECAADGGASGKKEKVHRYVLCEGATVRQFDLSGAVSAEVKAEECFVDLSTGSAWMEGKVRGKYGFDAPFGGDGIYFSTSEFFAKIYASVEITVDQ